MAAKVFEKSAEETAFRAVLKVVYESGKNSVAVLWADAALSARFQETLYAFLLKDVLGSAAAGVKLRALCAFCGGEAETAQTEYTHETFIGLMSPITKGENKVFITVSYDDELSIPLLEWNLVGADYECANFEEVKNKIDIIIKS